MSTDRDKSVVDTEDHRRKVSTFIRSVAHELMSRALMHDMSKLEEPELSMFAEYGPKLKEMEYGSEEYQVALKEMGKALKHHYDHNRHHPEHFDDGVSGMNLVDIMEMLCDWKAASLRMKQPDFRGSVEFNGNRFKIEPQLLQILINTIELVEGGK